MARKTLVLGGGGLDLRRVGNGRARGSGRSGDRRTPCRRHRRNQPAHTLALRGETRGTPHAISNAGGERRAVPTRPDNMGDSRFAVRPTSRSRSRTLQGQGRRRLVTRYTFGNVASPWSARAFP